MGLAIMYHHAMIILIFKTILAIFLYFYRSIQDFFFFFEVFQLVKHNNIILPSTMMATL